MLIASSNEQKRIENETRTQGVLKMLVAIAIAEEIQELQRIACKFFASFEPIAKVEENS